MPKKLVWKNCVGQQRIKTSLAAAFENNTLGHAYLFCGPAGVGKFQAALELTLALLCKHETDAPCYRCDSCNLVMKHAHPDFHCVFPVTLEKAHKSDGGSITEEGWQYIAELTRDRLAHPYTMSESRIPNIPVDWIRELNHAIMRGPVKGNMNVAIISDVDILEAASANAMLKTLEEPPRNTLIILMSQRPQSVLPTIRSRCQVIRFGSIAGEDLRQALITGASLDPQDARLNNVVEGAAGSYGKALVLLHEELDVYAQQAKMLWELCIRKRPYETLCASVEAVAAEHLGNGGDHAAAESLLTAFIHTIRTSYFKNINGTQTYINGESEGSRIDLAMVAALSAQCEKAITAVRAHGNILLVLITFIFSMMETIHGKK